MIHPFKTTTLTFVALLTFGCQAPLESNSRVADAEVELVHATQLSFVSSFDFAEATGQTYLQFMKDQVKPAMDELATDGYAVKGSDAVELAYNASNSKVKGKVNRWGFATVKDIAEQLEGDVVTLNTLPEKIRAVDRRVDVYGLSTFLGLASGGGVKIKYYDLNYGLNVHYDTSEERSGRSFGVGPTRGANDASDKQYLDDLQSYVKTDADNVPEFYRALLQSLLNSDASNYANITGEGQTVLTDFLSVFTAEQARNLMDGRVSPHWDAALLEVTLLAAFHGGQQEVKLYYRNPGTRRTSFTATTLKQTPCSIPTRETAASLRDYWQFSRNINSESACRRSGINITKSEFRKLGKDLTTYIKENHANLYADVKASLGISGESSNLFSALSSYLINSDTPAALDQADVEAITEHWVGLLTVIFNEAEQITAGIETN